MNISAGNELRGTVLDMKPGKATTHLRVGVPRHHDFEVVITSSSVEQLALTTGDHVILRFREVDVMIMKGDAAVSAVNRFMGRVLDMKKGTVTAEVPLAVNGERIVAVIARSAAEKMGVSIGDEVTAFVREVDILVQKDEGISTRNRVPGTVASLRPGTVTVEVTLGVDGGRHLQSLIARSSAEAMKLATGDRVTALIREGDVMIIKE